MDIYEQKIFDHEGCFGRYIMSLLDQVIWGLEKKMHGIVLNFEKKDCRILIPRYVKPYLDRAYNQSTCVGVMQISEYKGYKLEFGYEKNLIVAYNIDFPTMNELPVTCKIEIKK